MVTLPINLANSEIRLTFLLVNLDKFPQLPNISQLDPLYADLYRDSQQNFATPYHTQLELLVQLAKAQNATFKEKVIVALVDRKVKQMSKSPKKKENVNFWEISCNFLLGC
jgi:hypothetical protein